MITDDSEEPFRSHLISILPYRCSQVSYIRCNSSSENGSFCSLRLSVLDLPLTFLTRFAGFRSAKIVAAAWEETGKWDGAAPSNTPPEKPAGGATIATAVKAFLDEHKNAAVGTQRKYGFLMDKVTQFSSHKGYTRIKQWGPVDIREFRDTWKVAIQTANRDMSIIRRWNPDFSLTY